MFVDPYNSPFEAFGAVWRRVQETAPAGFDPATLALATAGTDLRPSVRMVLLRQADADGFVFYTNYQSRKAGELDANPQAALCGFWHWLRLQVRVEGRVERATAGESDAYFASRPRASRLGAWASPQSAPLESREDLERRYAAVERRFEGSEVPRPEFWGGYRLTPDRVEVWEERPDRLHDRVLWTPTPQGWSRVRLAP